MVGGASDQKTAKQWAFSPMRATSAMAAAGVDVGVQGPRVEILAHPGTHGFKLLG